MQNELLAKKSASWFYWVAGLSVVNSILYFFNVGVVFPTGLGIGQVMQYYFDSNNFAIVIASGFIYAIAIIMFLVSGFFATRGLKIFFIIGTALYALDTLLILGLMIFTGQFEIIVDLGFHILALIFMIRGIFVSYRN